MKPIGHTEGGKLKWSSTPLTNPLSPHTLYIPEPGTRENIDAEQFEHIGWINPDQFGADHIYPTHENAAKYGDARPAYIRRQPPAPPTPPVPAVDQPMTFYDHAFIAAYISVNETMTRDQATKYAHDVAGHLTRSRANRP